MKEHAFRLRRGQDLKQAIMTYVVQHNIQAGVIASGVGCLLRAVIRLADGKTVAQRNEAFEIVSLQGTVTVNGCHLHIALSDVEGITIGGHLCDGCLVNTTAEIVLFELPTISFNRLYDESTGYQELVIETRENEAK